jgi:hypothetical protein
VQAGETYAANLVIAQGGAGMTHGTIEKTDWQNLVTVRPGPVLHVWRNGAEFCNVPISLHACLALIGSLTAALQMAQTNTPNEGLPFATVKAERDAARAKYTQPGDYIGRDGE